jgi:hypothetical protein
MKETKMLHKLVILDSCHFDKLHALYTIVQYYLYLVCAVHWSFNIICSFICLSICLPDVGRHLAPRSCFFSKSKEVLNHFHLDFNQSYGVHLKYAIVLTFYEVTSKLIDNKLY